MAQSPCLAVAGSPCRLCVGRLLAVYGSKLVLAFRPVRARNIQEYGKNVPAVVCVLKLLTGLRTLQHPSLLFGTSVNKEQINNEPRTDDDKQQILPASRRRYDRFLFLWH